MIRLPIWRALGVLAFLSVAAPLYAASPDTKVANAWAAPNLFGSVALRVTKTPYDAKWRHAGISRKSPSKAARPAWRDLATVQREINRRISYRADSQLRGAGDAWSTAASTLALGSGDCEDYAIAKGDSLLARGFLPEDLYLVIGNDLLLRSAHAILVVRIGAKFWVLDNLASQVVSADDFQNFSPIITLSGNRKWVHGYKLGSGRPVYQARQRSTGLPTDRISAVRVAQSATQISRSPVL